MTRPKKKSVGKKSLPKTHPDYFKNTVPFTEVIPLKPERGENLLGKFLAAHGLVPTVKHQDLRVYTEINDSVDNGRAGSFISKVPWISLLVWLLILPGMVNSAYPPIKLVGSLLVAQALGYLLYFSVRLIISVSIKVFGDRHYRL